MLGAGALIFTFSCCFHKEGLKPHQDLLGNLQTNEGQTPGLKLSPLSVEGELLFCINWGLINVSKERLSDFVWIEGSLLQAATMPAVACLWPVRALIGPSRQRFPRLQGLCSTAPVRINKQRKSSSAPAWNMHTAAPTSAPCMVGQALPCCRGG